MPAWRKSAVTCATEGSHSVKITATELNSEIREVYWITDDLVFATMLNGQVVKTVDQGKTWFDVTEDMDGFGQSNGLSSLDNTVFSVHPTSDPNVVYFQGWDTLHWVTHDGGETYVKIDCGNMVLKHMDIHPNDPSRFIASAMRLECNTFDIDLNECYDILYVSDDFGASLREVTTYALIGTWGNVNKNPDEIFYWEDTLKSGYQHSSANHAARVYSRRFLRSSNAGENADVFFTHSAGFLYDRSSGRLYVARYDSEDHGRAHLFVSLDDGETLQLQHFPQEVAERNYAFVLDTGDVSFVNIEGGDSYYGELAVSDSNAVDYTISLNRNKRFVDGTPDLFRVPGVDGVFLSNSYDAKILEDPEHRESYVETLISFDQGGRWERLVPPSTSRCGQNESLEDCAQHLFLHSYFVDVLSHENAIGLIVAPGNTGQFLQSEFHQLDMYLSRDLGRTWSFFHEGAGIVEFGDHGGVMMLADTDYSDHIDITLSQGLDWVSCDLLSDANYQVRVGGLESPPNAKDIDFFAFGRAKDGSVDSHHREAVVLHFDLTEYGIRDCEGEDMPESPDSDYEYFDPSEDGEPTGCILGENVQFLRRKREAECYNGFEFEDKSILTKCPCSQDDYECDGKCFYSDPLTNACVPVCLGLTTDPWLQPDTCQNPGDSWMRTRGYRLVPGTKCDTSTGTNLLPERIECVFPEPPMEPQDEGDDMTYMSFHTSIVRGSSYFFETYVAEEETTSFGDFMSLLAFLTIVVLFIIIVSAVGFIVWRNSPRIRAMIRRRTGTASPDDFYTDSDL